MACTRACSGNIGRRGRLFRRQDCLATVYASRSTASPTNHDLRRLVMRSLVLALVVIVHPAARAQRVPTFVTAPLVSIDSVGDSTRMSSRFTDAKRLSDGRVVAAVCRANELRSYDATGKRLG